MLLLFQHLHASPQGFAGLLREEELLAAAVVTAHYPTLPAVVPSINQSELDLLAVHAGVGLTVGHPDCSVTVCRLLTRLPYELLNALQTL